jgi:outer membrane protein assembly factor BamB
MANATRVADVARGIYVGTYDGTTAAQNIHIGFKPAFIFAINAEDGDKIWIWSETSAHATKITTIDTEVANECVTIDAVDNGTVLGFSLPACTAAVNEDGKTYLIVAIPA